VRLEKLPLFQKKDCYPRPGMIEKKVPGPVETIIDDRGVSEEENECDCEIR
jgi:hypothetical protein